MKHREAVFALMIMLAAMTAGCAGTRGPQLVVNSHIDYNKAISEVMKEELLLNVVRRRYMEAPQFLSVSSINTNISRTARLGANASAGDVGNTNIIGAGVDGGVVFTDSPTITITARQGTDIATQLHQPLRP